MKISGTLTKAWRHAVARYSIHQKCANSDYKKSEDQTPLRAELYSTDQMEAHGQKLARAHMLDGTGTRDRLLNRLDENEQVLIETCNLLMLTVKSRLPIAPAGEWLLDNFHLIEDQIRTAKLHLPRSYYRELPLLGQGASCGLPRVYDLALEAISHGDGHVDDTFSRFIAAYQTVTLLTLGELWAIPIMLRLALIENLRLVCARITTTRTQINQAQSWANKMMETASSDPNSLILVIADMARSNPPMASPFVAELARRLQGQGPALALSLSWIEQRLTASNMTIERLVLSENQQQAADQVSISNSIGSLRFLGATDWRVFVETISSVEQVLREDIGGVYSKMDFSTRDRYRHIIARLASRSKFSETEVARKAIELAQQSASSNDGNNQTAHVGYFLIERGLPLLEDIVAVRLSPVTRLRRLIRRSTLALHISANLLLTLLFTAVLLVMVDYSGMDNWRLLLLGILSLVAASQLASSLVNWITTLLVQPQLLPRMDFTLGLVPEVRTLVVIPTLLSSVQNIENLLEALEVRFLGNRDKYLHFGLLTDFGDAADETLTEDESLLRLARNGIEALNHKYPGTDKDSFFLFHRPRRWNATEQIWMGYERKRGKLADLNAALRNGGKDYFSVVAGDIDGLSSVKYVITLDTDTHLPRDSARQFVAAMAHPLNHPQYDERKTRIEHGYGILQPCMAASLTGANRTLYAKLFGNESGIDPYTRSVSNVYQDLFGEGSFIGKGIYDVDAFEHALKGRFPENLILSHDLLEGCYARSGLLSDVCLYEDYPSRYQIDVDRQRRWIRGDWQIANWLLPYVPGPQGSVQPNPLSLLSRFKIFDNLRRSVVPFALILLLMIGWFLAPHAGLWTLPVVGIILVPPLLVTFVSLFHRPETVSQRQYLRALVHSAGHNLAQAVFRIACLPYDAMISLDAILSSVWRMLISHRRLLEWKAYGENDHKTGNMFVTTYSLMWGAPVIAVIVATGLVQFRSEALVAAAPVLVLWFLAPALAWWISRPLIRREPGLNPVQKTFLRKIARKTWAFYERFVVAEDNWLPPDNYQANPDPVIAHRTSPTNIGLMLLANLTALDFGYISAGSLLARSANTFRTLSTLERHRGHFYNWYDTESLLPLPPRYISSVDSGNFVGHLLTLRAGLIALPDQKIVAERLFEGLADTLGILEDTRLDKPEIAFTRLQALLDTICAEVPASLPAVKEALELLVNSAATMLTEHEVDPSGEVWDWAIAFERQCREALDDLEFLAPWLVLPAGSNALDKFLDYADMDYAGIPTLRERAKHTVNLLSAIDARMAGTISAEQHEELIELRRLISVGGDRAAERMTAFEQLVIQVTGFATIEYEFLYDRTRQLLAVGYNVDELRRDNSFYDLLASEARLCSFVAIAQGQLPQESWFALSRLLTTAGGEPVLLSWSGSMFEYLMPLLVMPAYVGTLLEQSCRAAVARQIAYGKERSLPWGVSESGYNTFDTSLNYQYHAFGVPGLGLKRGLAEDSVVTPYASALALMVAPEAACANLQRLANSGLEGQFGFYEAIDYTPSRLTRDKTSCIVRSFMAHHQGMILLSLAHLVLEQPMQRRFLSEPIFQATLLLLQERVPKTSITHIGDTRFSEGHAFTDATKATVQASIGYDTLTPEVQLLSNSRYHVMVTNAGGGYSRWRDLAVSRWHEDSTCDNWGAFVYLRDVSSGEFWSATHQPTLKKADSYEAMFTEGRAEFRRRDHDIETYTEIVVSPEDDIELRRLRITNRSNTPRMLEITSYAEVVLALPVADRLHPSFGNLFMQTEIIGSRRAILCTRRPRSINEQTPWMFHLVATNGTDIGEISYETDRMRFIGRGRTIVSPQAMNNPGTLSGSHGSVLDPIVAIRCPITLDAGQTVTIDVVSGVADSREACMTLVGKYQDRHLADRVFDIAFTHRGVMLRQINASQSDEQLYRRLASAVLYVDAAHRADVSVLIQNRRGQSGLWGYAISGDLPIVLLKIADPAHIDLARQLIRCHAYWRLKGLAVDLVIWNEDHVGYRQYLQDQIMALIATGTEANAIDRPGGIFLRSAEQISHEDRILIKAAARVIIADNRGTLLEQVNRRRTTAKRVARLTPTRPYRPESARALGFSQQVLLLGNELGGFSSDGREYVITTTQTQVTPAPWVNVLANPNFGTVITESGLAYSWGENAHEFRLTPWSDDPVGATGGEAIYLRDEDSGHFWSPTPLPVRGVMPYTCRHGFGYSVFEHNEGGIYTELWIYVDIEEMVKFSVLKVRNGSGRSRRLSATGYIEWVLGDLRSKTAMHVVTEVDAASGALCARNAYNTEFKGRVAFFDVDDLSRTLSGDRTEFIGRNSTLQDPQAMSRLRLSGKTGAGLDPCGAIQVFFNLSNGEEREVIFRLGAGINIEKTRDLALRLRTPGAAHAALEKVKRYWNHTLGAVQIETPDPALNVLANGWLVYQTMASRLWARSGFYQSSGAFGFRDQLQDVMALVHAEPGLMREHILRCAERQYPEGDVQHWWHPPSGRGLRTRCSDDYLWLPLVTCRYVLSTGDVGILEEKSHFLQGRALGAEEESYYDLPGRSEATASLYQHCRLAILHGLRFGEHGLPLMGSGDWNDGMNLVGIHGKGESVWLGFFLYQVLMSFAEIASLHKDHAFVERCRKEAAQLRLNLAEHAWDGAWYRRAWFDDGTPLGTSENSECVIDSISQSWSVLSGAGDAGRSQQAMDAVDQRLVRRADGLIQLLDPPFDKSTMNPGYIKGYVPGVRENGGQYTHAAIWAAMAFAAQGDSRRAWELLRMINPVNHTLTSESLSVYKTEPYVVAADVYAVPPHTGRGGWTWYTGSAGWLYRLMLESLLGLNRKADRLSITPCIPGDWKTYSIKYRYGETMYRITVNQTRHPEVSDSMITVDGIKLADQDIILVDDHREHDIEISMNQRPTKEPVSKHNVNRRLSEELI